MRSGVRESPISVIFECLVVWPTPTYQMLTGKENLARKQKNYVSLDTVFKRRGIDEGTSKVTIRRDVIFNESDFQRDSTAVDVSEKVNGREKDEDILVEQLEQPQTEEREDVEEDQQRYPRRQRTVPVRYGIDEYIDIEFLGGEEPQSIEEALDSKLSKKCLWMAPEAVYSVITGKIRTISSKNIYNLSRY